MRNKNKHDLDFVRVYKPGVVILRAYHDYFKEPMILANSARLRSKVHICL